MTSHRCAIPGLVLASATIALICGNLAAQEAATATRTPPKVLAGEDAGESRR